jgi:GT2 family glycosyltransferase
MAPVNDIIIPNYNGAALLPDCLNALRAQTRRDFVATVVDDGSADGSLALLARDYPEVRVLALERNGGVVSAVNAAFRATSSPFLVLLNNDAAPEPRWLERLVGALERHPAYGFAASKLMLFDRRDHLHSAGDGYTVGGVPVNRGAWQRDDGRFDGSVEIFGACAGAAAYRRRLLDEVGGFDEWLHAYLEDVDLSWRAQLRGWRCRFVPEARVYHHVSASGGGVRPSYYCGRNFLLVLASDVPAPLLRRHWRAILRQQGGIVWEALRHLREPAARARISGYLAGARDLPAAVARRRRIQARRTAPIERLEALLAP